MPWYFTIGLFLLSPLYGLVIKDFIIPRYQRWRAERSSKSLQIRIGSLKDILNISTHVQRLTYFEDEILFILKWACIASAAGIQAFVYIWQFPNLKAPWNMKPQELAYIVLSFLVGGVLSYCVGHLSAFREYRSPVIIDAKQLELKRLEVRLLNLSTQAGK